LDSYDIHKIAFNVEPYIIDKCDMDVVLEAGEDQDEMIPFFSIASRGFDNYLVILKKVLHQFEQRTHSENAYRFSERATLAAGQHQHKNKKAATLKIVDTFQDQIKKNGSDAMIKMYGDIPLAAGWWSWLLR
jgi:hypothetical protein